MGKATQQERRKQDRERLEAATKALMGSEGWRDWLDTRARFHSYSLGNQLLIAFQRPDATQVAGYRKWQELGRQVRKGEKAIRILAPMGGPCRSCDGNGSKVFSGEGALTCGRCMGSGRWQAFKSVSVFDVSQTEGEELPTMPREPLTGGSHAPYLAQLEAYAAELGYKVRYGPTGSKGGWCDYADREIVVSEDKAPNGRVRTLIHEITHALGIGFDYPRDVAEVIVESVAYVVASSIGLDTSGETLTYLAAWSGSDDLEALKGYASTIDDLAGKIEAAVGIGETADPRAA